MGRLIQGDAIVAGNAAGELLVGRLPLSFWGGVDPASGDVIDRRHDLAGQVLTGKVLVLPHGRGSCSASGVLFESICNGTAPAAIVTGRLDPIIGLGAILAEELHGLTMPVLVVPSELLAEMRTGQRATIVAAGQLCLGEP